MGLVGPWHVRSSQTRDRTRVPCIGRQILNHCVNGEVLFPPIFITNLLYSFGSYFSSLKTFFKNECPGFPGGAVVESLPAGAGDTGSGPGLGRSHMQRSN